MISQSKLDFWINNNLNVLFFGRHGVGKTSAVIEAFNRHKLNWMYFSVSTMDPWVDFVGVPKEKQENGLTYLDLIRPKAFMEDKVEAIFLDEFNRGVDKVRNAVLELIQFKSINGKKFNNLKVVWAACNPEDDISEYDVAKLDWAQKDRFQVHVDVPYELDKSYFVNKYGDVLAQNVYDWWNGLGNEQRMNISPRRVDYLLQMYELGGDLHDVVPSCANVSHLITTLKQGSIKSRLEDIMRNNNVNAAIRLMKNDTSYDESLKYILEDSKMADFFLPLVNKEKITGLVIEGTKEGADNLTMQRLSSLYTKSDYVKSILRTFYEEFQTKHNIQQNIRIPDTDKFGKNVHKIPRLNFNRAPIDGFIEKVNLQGCNHNTPLNERKEMYQYILDNIGLGDKGRNGNAAVSILFVGKLIKYIEYNVVNKNIEELHKILFRDFPYAFTILNESLQAFTNKDHQDIRTCEFWKMVKAKLIETDLEQYVWIPN